MTATVAFVGGPVFTSDAARSWTDGVAVHNGTIVAIGAEATREVIGPGTDIVDLTGRMLVPGFIDAHVHPVFGGLELQHCDLVGSTSAADCLDRIAAYAAGHRDRSWIVGGGWSMDHFPAGTPTREDLDLVTGDRPAYLINRDRHGAWANTAALRLAGVTADTPDPAQGRIERRADGSPDGTLHEAAADLVARHLPERSPAEYDEALLDGQRHLHRYGVTSWQDALIGDYLNYADAYDAYRRAEAAGTLTARVVGALWWERERGFDQLERMLRRRDETAGGRFRTTTVKLMQDGVCENFTAALLSPYVRGNTSNGHADHPCGLSYIEPELLAEIVTAIDGHGFQAHFHTIGDRAIREALDAIEVAIDRRASVSTGHRGDPRHHLAHIQVVDADDIPRFRALGVAANMQPLWANLDPQMAELTIPFLGAARARRQYPFEQLRAAGTVMVAGSDWPVSSADPLAGIHVAVNRIAPHDRGGTAFTPHQRLALSDALAAYTSGSAWINHAEHAAGTIAVGRVADLAVLDRDLFAGAPNEIADARVDLTFVDGSCVHERSTAAVA